MYYHVRMDKPDYIGGGKTLGVDEKDFRSLRACLNWVQSAYGKWALCWQIDGIDGSKNDARKLLPALECSIDESFQWVYMGVNKSCPDYRKCDAYCFTVSKRDGDPEKGFSFTETDEAAMLSEDVFAPDVNRSIKDILGSFEVEEDFDVIGNAIDGILISYGGCEDDIPLDVEKLKNKKKLSADEYVALADECQNCDEEQFAVKLYAKGYSAAGIAEKKGEALVKLAELYMNSEWPRNGGREWDVMKAVDLLTEALSLGCVASARDALEGMREQLFEEFEDEPDVDYFIRNYQADALCLAAFCLGVGIGWKKDIAASKRLYEAALAQGYFRASYYLNEIRSGRV